MPIGIDLRKMAEHFPIVGEYIPFSDEHIESFVDANNVKHSEIICDKCGEVRYIPVFSPTLGKTIWKSKYIADEKNHGCLCIKDMYDKAKKRRDEYNLPEYSESVVNGKTVVKCTREARDFIKEHDTWEHRLVINKNSIPDSITSARIEDRFFMNPKMDDYARSCLRTFVRMVYQDGEEALDNLYITGGSKSTKTRCLFALRNAMLEGTVDAVYTNVDQIIAVMNAQSSYLSTILTAKVLLIDCLGYRELSERELIAICLFLEQRKSQGSSFAVIAGIPRIELKSISNELYDIVMSLSGDMEISLTR